MSEVLITHVTSHCVLWIVDDSRDTCRGKKISASVEAR